ncbi:MAG: hypothetical protein LBF83_04620, partial [Spirochaetaceae bacterium]|nr:hypothetical protein [Spirochaetaceae bacterium]
MKLLILRKSKAANYKDRLRKLMDRRGDNTPDARLEKFRKLILEHLSTPDDEEPEPEAAPPAVRKAFSSMIRMEKGGKGLAVGTVREWKGRKFKKTAPGKWRPVYDSETRGAKMAIAAIKKKIAAATDAQTMMRIILENRDRFSDKNGQPLPFVQELSKYTADQQDRRGHAENTPQESKAVQPKGEKGKGQEKTPEGKKETGRAVKADKGKKQSDGSDDGGNDEDAKRRIISNLETMAVLMDRREFTKDNYKKLFPNAKVKTPIGDVKIGENQYEKLRDKDDGGRKGLIGAMYQTLSDPVAVIREKRNGENADVYIKSFKKDGEQGIDTVISVTIEAEGMNVAISTYKRKTREVIQKIKTAGGIVYEKTKLPSLTDHAETASQLQVSPESGGESSDFEKIREKYKNATFAEGDDDEIQVGKELISGKWKLVEADTPTASHDETSFHKTPGFPTTDDGSTINDRDYGHDKEAQEIVMEIGADYDGRAVSVDNPVIVTKDGIVISGNNRTMSSKIAARKGADKGYIEALKKKAKKFGFTPEQIDQFKHPRVIFETAENKGYSTDQFAKFNKSSKKAMSPVEAAVKVSKTIKMDTVESIAGKMIDFETLGALYADRNVVNDIFNALQRDNIITSMDRPQYVVDGGITGAGKEFLETVLIGSVINESNIRGLNREGCKSIRQKLVRAITPLIENKGMDGYSITKELNSAVDIAMQAAVDRKHFKDVDDFSRQKKLFDAEDSAVEIEIAKKLEGTQKEFAAFMQSMNGGLKYAA